MTVIECHFKLRRELAVIVDMDQQYFSKLVAGLRAKADGRLGCVLGRGRYIDINPAAVRLPLIAVDPETGSGKLMGLRQKLSMSKGKLALRAYVAIASKFRQVEKHPSGIAALICVNVSLTHCSFNLSKEWHQTVA